MIEQALVDRLNATAAVTALVSDRIGTWELPQDETMPAITLQRLSGPRDYTHDGASGLEFPGFQLTCWAETLKSAKDVAVAVRDALSGFKGTIGTDRVDGVFLENESHRKEQDPRKLWRVDFDLRVIYAEL